MTDPVLLAALAAEAPYLFGAVEIAFPDYTLRLLDGSSELMIGGHLFVGEDATFGVLDTASTMEDAIAEEAPQIEIGLLPPSATAAATLANGLMQGSVVKVMLGVADPTTNTVIGVPEIVFAGEIDVPTLSIAKGTRQVSYTVVTVFERLFEVNEGVRASDGWQKSIWPEDRGMENVTGTDRNLYWGAKRPIPQYVLGGPVWRQTYGLNPDYLS